MRTLSTIPIRQEPAAPFRTRRSVRRRSPDPECRKLGGPFGTLARHGGMPTGRIDPKARRPAKIGSLRSADRVAPRLRVAEPRADQQRSFTREDLLTASDVAAVLQIKRTTALDYMRRGVIPASKIGRRWYALRSLLDAHIADLFEAELHR